MTGTIAGQAGQAARPGPAMALRAARRQSMGIGQREQLVSRSTADTVGARAASSDDDEWAQLARGRAELGRLVLGG